MMSLRRWWLVPVLLVSVGCGDGSSNAVDDQPGAPSTSTTTAAGGASAPDEVGDQSTRAATPGTDDLTGRNFTFDTLVVDGEQQTLSRPVLLRFESDRLALDLPCNGHSGAYEVVEGRLGRVGEWAQTLVGCEGELGTQEEGLIELFSARPALELVGDELTLDAGSFVAVAHEVTAP